MQYGCMIIRHYSNGVNMVNSNLLSTNEYEHVLLPNSVLNDVLLLVGRHDKRQRKAGKHHGVRLDCHECDDLTIVKQRVAA